MAILLLFRDAIKAYFGERATIYAAGLAYYAVFAIAPLLAFIIAVAGLFVGRSAAIEQVSDQAQFLVGPELAALLGELAETAGSQSSSAGLTLLGIAGLLFSGAGIFTQLDTALNDIWGIRTVRPQGLTDRLLLFRHKLGPFALVCFLGLLLSSSVIIDTLLIAAAQRLAVYLPQAAALEPHINRLVIPALTFITFAVIFKWLPDARSRWRDIAAGALVTTLLFLIGRFLLNLYLERSQTAVRFGTVASLAVLLIWVYVSAQIVLFGAEFTKLYADRFGQPIEPRRMTAFEDDIQAAAAGAALRDDH